MATVGADYDVILVARSDGVLAADVRPLVRVSVNVIVEQDGKREQGHFGGGGRHDLAYFTDERLAEYANQAVDQALVNLVASPARPESCRSFSGPAGRAFCCTKQLGTGSKATSIARGRALLAESDSASRPGCDGHRRRHNRESPRLVERRR